MAPSTTDFDSAHPLTDLDRYAIELYLREGLSVDQLAYTDEFERIYTDLQKRGETRERRDIYRLLLRLRKVGQLPRVDSARPANGPSMQGRMAS
jgi:hypothetical protein